MTSAAHYRTEAEPVPGPRFYAVDRDGQYVGEVAHVVAERGERRASGLVIQRNGNEMVLPLEAVQTADGSRIVLRDEAARYRELPPFYRAGYRVIDEELEAAMEIEEDFQIGADENANEPQSVALEQHTGAENPYRVPVMTDEPRDQPIGRDATDMNPASSNGDESTRRDMH